jgi:hypothetical protein
VAIWHNTPVRSTPQSDGGTKITKLIGLLWILYNSKSEAAKSDLSMLSTASFIQKSRAAWFIIVRKDDDSADYSSRSNNTDDDACAAFSLVFAFGRSANTLSLYL